MPLFPSTTYVAQKLFEAGLDEETAPWEDAPQDQRDTNMTYARVAISAIQSWQALHRPDGSSVRYRFELNPDKEDPYSWAIYDRKAGLDKPLGYVHDALLAQQIVDDLNRFDT